MSNCKQCFHLELCGKLICRENDGTIACGDFINKADVEVVRHGEWKASVMSTGAPHCSLCNGVAQSRYTYCPHCGAKMDGGNAE